MPAVVFDYSAWSARYPELGASVAAPLATLCFGDATLYLDNGDGSVVQDVTQRTSLLYMLTAHIAAMTPSEAGNARLAGPLASAQQGTVNVSIAAPEAGTPQWYQQTVYGRNFWQATARFRTARYVAARPTVDSLWQRRRR